MESQDVRINSTERTTRSRGSWDSFSYATTVPHCVRRVDTSPHYPEEDTLILRAQFDMPDPTMPQLAQGTVDTAQSLYGISTAKKVKDAFVARGILYRR
jgi:hypothetical protein